LACSALPARPVPVTNAAPQASPASAEQSLGVPAAAESWPDEGRLFLVTNARAELELRAEGSDFVRRLAANAQHVLYDPELELVWFSDDQRLWVIDLRHPAPATVAPVPIAGPLPPHVEIHIDRGGTHRVEPTDACDVAPILVLHWESEPWIEDDEGQPSTPLEGRAWLAREGARVARSVGAERWLHPADAHLPLPPARARCEDPEWCGAAQPFAASGWQLVLAEQSEGADCWQFGCLLFDSANGTFGTPPRPSQWGPAEDTPVGPCGPYRFDAAGSAFLIGDLLCAAGGSCQPLGGSSIGWLTPGATLGSPG
jgi:hypothetical protein